MSKAPAVAPVGRWTGRNLSPGWVTIPETGPGVTRELKPLAVVRVEFIARTIG